MKWHTAELLVLPAAERPGLSPGNGERVGENCRSSQLLVILPGTGSGNATGEREPPDWCEQSATALGSCRPSRGRVQCGPHCDVLVHGHGSAKVAYESTFQFHSSVNELHAVFVMLTADI